VPATSPALPLAERIHTVRGHRVMLDAGLAQLYGVATKALTQAVKRSARRGAGPASRVSEPPPGTI